MKVTLQALMISSLLFGCSAAPPEPPGLTPDAGEVDPDTDGGDRPVEVKLALDDVVSQTNETAILITGRGPANGRVLYHIPGDGEEAEPLDSAGDFSVCIPLQLGQENTLSFQAIAPNGEKSAQKFITVTQTGDSPEPEPEPTAGLRKVTGLQFRGGTMEATVGEVENMFDGRAATAVTMENATFDFDWFEFTLPEEASINKIRIITQDDKPLEDYGVYLSAKQDPESLNGQVDDPLGYGTTWSDDWTEIAVVSNGTADYTVEPTVVAQGRHLAIWVASSYTAFNGENYFHEIEVFTEDAGDKEPPQTNSCSNGSL
jgi:hypothetical protein